ncbi:unnamed protein product [Allacma fusca]|uniref:Secreted protein n=1 Tax=Allacma fusca TaxID=39272 RepID=A0A8J2PLZ1_9HEXA|nr:unnamed protein product [Allacma fusca]
MPWSLGVICVTLVVTNILMGCAAAVKSLPKRSNILEARNLYCILKMPLIILNIGQNTRKPERPILMRKRRKTESMLWNLLIKILQRADYKQICVQMA